MGPPLWVVTLADAEVFLLGALPGAKDVGWLSAEIVAAVGRGDEVWFEVPPDDDPASHPVLAEIGFSSVPLSDRLGPVRWSQFGEAGRSVGLDPAGMEPLRPWLAGQLLDRALVQASDADPDADVDRVIAALATDRDILHRSEFTTEGVLRFFGDLPDAVELAFVDLMIDRVERGAERLSADGAEWAAGGLRAADEEARRIAECYPALHDRLGLVRNRAWLPRIDAMLGRPGTRFVVVGLLHLVGDNSVLALLREKGHVVDTVGSGPGAASA